MDLFLLICFWYFGVPNRESNSGMHCSITVRYLWATPPPKFYVLFFIDLAVLALKDTVPTSLNSMQQHLCRMTFERFCTYIFCTCIYIWHMHIYFAHTYIFCTPIYSMYTHIYFAQVYFAHINFAHTHIFCRPFWSAFLQRFWTWTL